MVSAFFVLYLISTLLPSPTLGVGRYLCCCNSFSLSNVSKSIFTHVPYALSVKLTLPGNNMLRTPVENHVSQDISFMIITSWIQLLWFRQLKSYITLIHLSSVFNLLKKHNIIHYYFKFTKSKYSKISKIKRGIFYVTYLQVTCIQKSPWVSCTYIMYGKGLGLRDIIVFWTAFIWFVRMGPNLITYYFFILYCLLKLETVEILKPNSSSQLRI